MPTRIRAGTAEPTPVPLALKQVAMVPFALHCIPGQVQSIPSVFPAKRGHDALARERHAHSARETGSFPVEFGHRPKCTGSEHRAEARRCGRGCKSSLVSGTDIAYGGCVAVSVIRHAASTRTLCGSPPLAGPLSVGAY